MKLRTLSAALVVGALLLPMALVTPAQSVGTTAAPDLSIRSFTVTHPPMLPPWKFLLTVRVCNEGNAPVAAGAPLMHYSVQAQPGLLRAGSDGPNRDVNLLAHEKPLGPNDCAVTLSAWGLPTSMGEYEFTIKIVLASDSDLSDNVRKVKAAWPEQLQGSGVGGVDAFYTEGI